MEERIIKFISALRSAGVRVSLAESVDAFNAVEKLGIQDRATFRSSLRATLIKDAKNLVIFDELFTLFFSSSGTPPLITNLVEDLTPDEARMLAEALRQFSDHLRHMLESLLNGEPLSKDELDRLARFVGLAQMDDLRYRNWMVQRMVKALRFPEVRQAMEQLAAMLAQMGMDKQRVEGLRQMLLANQNALENQLRLYAGERIADNLSQKMPDDGLDGLLNRPFNDLSDKDMQRLRREVQRLATALRTRVALRQKHAKSGQLDAKATIRANLKHGNVPILIKHREHTLKPKLVVICDVSTSMRSCSELMLSLLYALQDQISKTHAYAFIDHLEYISPDFDGKEAKDAVHAVLQRMPSGYYNTDLGNSLENFSNNYLDAVDSRTTFLIVGDGRNNYNDPRYDLFDLLSRRSRRMLWINPEAPTLWGTGDSDMLKYAAGCDVILHASTLAELIDAVDKLLG
ncbi:MAG: hypothetical protein A2W33_09520 [Chloroflexi bacterium RBG_16_52_11]|nr:MAG: hypothetical protein A2W33_09520 [Chloroflexi bacterium RBG_16_52_11]